MFSRQVSLATAVVISHLMRKKRSKRVEIVLVNCSGSDKHNFKLK